MAEKLVDIIRKYNDGRAQVKEIFEEINQEIATDATLSDLNSVSKTAKYKLYHYVSAVINWIQQTLWDEKKAQIERIFDERLSQNDFWLSLEIRKFQYGDSLEVDETTGEYGYALIDEDKQIIKRVAVTSASGFYTAKVAKEDGEGDPIPLDAGELQSLTTYLDAIVLGNNGRAISINADRAKIQYKIFYSPVRALDEIKTDVEAAINTYLATLDFKGQYLRWKFEDALQLVDDVEGYERTLTEFRTDAGIFAEIESIYLPSSGYIRIDDDFPLVENLSYVAI